MSTKPAIMTRETVAVFHALSQETRLEAYRLLLRYQPFDLTAGDISRLLSVPHNTLSTHLPRSSTAPALSSRGDRAVRSSSQSFPHAWTTLSPASRLRAESDGDGAPPA
mgnify:FL=1